MLNIDIKSKQNSWLNNIAEAVVDNNESKFYTHVVFN